MHRHSARLLTALLTVATTALAPLQGASAQTATSASGTGTPPAGITLVSAGDAPRRALRFAFVAGTSESVTTRQEMRMEMAVDGMALPPQSLPPTLMTMRTAIENVAADGTASVRGEIVDVDVEASGEAAEMAEALRGQLAQLRGTSIRYTVSPTGRISEATVDGTDAVKAQAVQIVQATEQLSVNLPAEPVGVGARWTTMRPMTQNGLTIDQRVEYTVAAIDAESVTLDVKVTQSARDVAMDASALPPGASAKVRTLDGEGSGTTTIRFSGVQPSGRMSLVLKMAIDVSMGGDVNAMNQTVSVEMAMTPASTPPAR